MSSSCQLSWLQNSQKYLPDPIFSGALFIWVWTEGLSESETDMRKRTVKSRLLYPHFTEAPRTWEPESHFLCRVSVLAVHSLLLEVVWSITVLQLLSHGDTRFAISIVWLLNPSMVMSVCLPEAGKSSTVMIVDTSLEIHRTASASAGHLHREDHRPGISQTPPPALKYSNSKPDNL